MENLTNSKYMSKEQRLKLIGILVVIPMIAGATYLAFSIGFKKPTTETTSKISQPSSQTSNSKLVQPIDVNPIPAKKTELRVDFTKESYNLRVEELNIKIKLLKTYTSYAPTKIFCDNMGNVRAEAEYTLRPLQLDINFNSKAPQFEKIVNDTKGLEIACEQHLAGSTGLFEDYKKQYIEYIKNLNELPKVD